MASSYAYQFLGRFGGSLLRVGPLAADQLLFGRTHLPPIARTVTGDGSFANGVLTILALASARLGKEGAVIKARIATTTNDSLAGLAARDGVTPGAGDVVLVKDHATGASKGLYLAASGGWTRLKDAAGGDSFAPGILIVVNEGTANGGNVYRVSNATLVVGTDTPTFDLVRGPLAILTAMIAAQAVTFAKAAVFISAADVVATGSAQNVAHGLTGTPSRVLIVPVDTTDAGIIAAGYTITPGTHDGTNVKFTATANLKVRVFAWA